MKIAVAGVGYVGLSLAALLAQHHQVIAVTTTPAKAERINAGESPIADSELQQLLQSDYLNLFATTDKHMAYQDADYIIVATPTNYDPDHQSFDTSAVEDVIESALQIQPHAMIVIKSTIPVGYTESVRRRFGTKRILFSPEFLREGKALYDNYYPSRIIVGTDRDDPEMTAAAEEFINLLLEGAKKQDVEARIIGTTEAEAVKLFANTYLALRVSFFNELDTYAEVKGLQTAEIIDGICLDPRIGSHYNNPSFGYGGYCLPKDTKQLLADYEGVPEALIEAIVAANDTRKQYVADRAYTLATRSCVSDRPTIGVYRLVMKTNSDNSRQSAVQDIISLLCQRNARVLVYEPVIGSVTLPNGAEYVSDLDAFLRQSDLILANRLEPRLESVLDKVYTRDLFRRD